MSFMECGLMNECKNYRSCYPDGKEDPNCYNPPRSRQEKCFSPIDGKSTVEEIIKKQDEYYKPKKSEQNMSEKVKPTFTRRVIKQTTHYYKKLFILGVEGIALLAIIYGTIVVSTATFPVLVGVVSAVISAIPLWAYIPAGIIIIPIIVAVVVCLENRNDVQVSKEDEDYVCQE